MSKLRVLDWLKNVKFDGFGTQLWAHDVGSDEISHIADVRGWGTIQNKFKTEKEASHFQDQIGVFIAEAINEKVVRESANPEELDKKLDYALLSDDVINPQT
jgi:hypothetical protein